jgi:hypothetical protein
MKNIILFCSLVFVFFGKAQTGGDAFDTLYDHLGNKYTLTDLMINKDPNGGTSAQKNSSANQITAAVSYSTAGYFNLYWAPGSGFDGPNSPDVNRRNVLIQLFTDLSCLIVSPLSSPCNPTTNNNTFVNVYIDGFTTGPAGLGSPIFAAPLGANIGASLVDCMAYKTIVSGIDGYTGIASPLITTGSNFYHILLKFNTTLTWDYNLSSATTSLTDFYTVALHEAMHGLGFVSMMDQNGHSLFSPYCNIFSKYDLRLRTGNPPVNPVISSTNIPCGLTSLTTNTPFVANPGNCSSTGNSNFTPFATMCQYVSSTTSMTVPVYTPLCFESGSSWSHFEDQWYGSPTYYGNDNYFVMSNQYGGVKRYPREEEKIVLCDLGYSTAGQYVSPVAGAAYTYTNGACNTLSNTVWGFNDGISNNTITYNAIGGVVSIPTVNIKANDSPNTSFLDCVSFVYNYPMTLSTAGGSITVTYPPGPIQYCGVVLVQYVPKDVNGNPGNITYIYMNFPCGNCNPPNLCDLVQNGGFENIIPSTNATCGGAWVSNNTPSCWDRYIPTTPDIWTGLPSCSASTYYFGSSNAASYAINNTYNGSPNYNVAGLTMNSGVSVGNTQEEVIKNNLSTPMVPGATYLLSFWARNSHSTYNPQGLPNVLTFATRTNFSAVGGSSYPSLAVDNVIANFTLMPADFNTWKHYSATIVFNGNANHKCLVVGMDPGATTTLNNNSIQNSYYTFIDDVSLVEISNALILTPPAAVCLNAGLTNLSQYCNQPNAVFSGPNVVLNAGSYDFSPASPGNYTITATYTNNVGCTYTTQANVVVPGMSITPSSTLFCNYLNYTLTAVPVPTNITVSIPFWQPTNQISTSIVVPGNNATTYLASSQYNGCPLLAMFTPTIVPNTVITATPDIWCANTAFTMNVSTPNFSLASMTQTWSPPINSNANTVSVTYSNSINPVYSVTTAVGGCTNLATYTATWLPPPTIAVSPTNCLAPNASATLTANSTSTLPITYTWQPGNFNTQQIVVTPTAPTIYTLSYSSGTSCAVSSTVGIYPAPQFANVPPSLCSGSNFSYLQFLLAPGTPTTGTFTGFGTFTTAVGGQTLTSINISTTTIPGPYTYTYSYVTPAGCSVTNTFVINIAQGITLTVPNPNVTYCANIAVGATVAVIATPSANVTYTWLPGPINTPSFVATPTVNTNYVVTASNGSCTAKGRVSVTISNSCCASANYINTSSVSNQTFTGLYAINQDLTINGNVVFSGEFLIAPTVSITVAPGATLSSGQHTVGIIGQGLHMLSCGNTMWHGIIVQNGGKVVFFLDDLIEDAEEAIVSDGCTSTSGVDIDVKHVAFNRNNISIAIRNYNQTTGTPPFEIYNCVFTCRDLQIPLNSFIWPTAPQLSIPTTPANPLATPYTMSGYNSIFCKLPYNTRHSLHGVEVENSGVTIGPTNPTPFYSSIDIGSGTGVTTNIFDNQAIGIYSRNSNVNSYYNVFQNSQQYLISSIPVAGIGIYAFNDDLGANHNTRLNLVAIQSPATSINTFYDCHHGIYAYRLFELNCQYQDFRSLQNSSVAFSNTLTGQDAIFSTSNRYKNYTITQNSFKNIRTGVYIGGLTGPLSLPSIPSFGSYFGKITISENLFTPTTGTTASVGNGFLYQGVYADAAISTSTNTFYEPGSVMRIEKNNFDRVWRGVFVGNFSNQSFNAITNCNTITLIKDIQNPSYSQRGVEYVGNRMGVITSNTVTGFSVNAPNTAGVYCSQNFSTTVRCNSVSVLNAGFEFNSSNPLTSWKANTMQTCRHGLELNSNGTMGQQGTFSAPSDNKWAGSWTNPDKQTYTDPSSNALNSVLWVRAFATSYLPLINLGSYNTLGAIQLANLFAPYPVCLSCVGTGNGGCNGCRNITGAGEDHEKTIKIKDEETEIYYTNLFRAIDEEPSLLETHPELEEFYNAQSISNKGVLLQIEKELNGGKLRSAKNMVSYFQPATVIETNYKKFYELLEAYQDKKSWTSAETQQLIALAKKCPATNGSVIYQARALRTIVSGEINLYDDDKCDARDSDAKANEDVNWQPGNFIMYPNPAQNVIYIGTNSKEGQIKVVIRDVNQKLLIQKQINVSEGLSELRFDLSDGVYFVELIASDNTSEFKKLIITK